MSRRDTIIIAVLLNTGLLAILFVMAINPVDDKMLDQRDLNHAFAEVQAPPAPPQKPLMIAHESSGDEVDNVLKDFAATMSHEALTHSGSQSEDIEREVLAMTSPPLPASPSAIPLSVEQKAVKSQTAEPQTNYVEVAVKRGDILGRIAQANGSSVNAIKRMNHLTSDKLKVGQVLKIPVDGQNGQTQAKVAVSETPSKLSPKTDDGFARYYTVESGDNPWKIAKKFNVSVADLLRINDLDESKARNLKPGDRVRVH